MEGARYNAAHAEQHWIEGLGTARLYERGEPVYRAGERADSVFVVVRGLVKLSRRHAGDRQVVLRVGRRGELFGVPAKLTYTNGSRPVRDHDAVPLTDTIVRQVPHDRFIEIMQQDASLACMILGQLNAQLRDAEGRLGELMYDSVRERLTSTLLALSSEVGRTLDDGDVLLDARLTHRDLAAIIGATRETVSAAIVRLRNEGWIGQSGRRLVLHQPARWQA